MGEGENGRNRRIRTSDPRLPKTVLYQAELCSEPERAPISQRLQPDKRQPPILCRCTGTVIDAEQELQAASGLSMSRPSSQLGCRQVVRHRFLVPTFPGSNPGTPATFLFRSVSVCAASGLLRSLWLQIDRFLVACRSDSRLRAANCDASLCLHIKTVSFLNCYRSTIDQRGCYC